VKLVRALVCLALACPTATLEAQARSRDAARVDDAAGRNRPERRARRSRPRAKAEKRYDLDFTQPAAAAAGEDLAGARDFDSDDAAANAMRERSSGSGQGDAADRSTRANGSRASAGEHESPRMGSAAAIGSGAASSTQTAPRANATASRNNASEPPADSADAVGFGTNVSESAAYPTADSADAVGFGNDANDSVGFGDTAFSPSAETTPSLAASEPSPVKLSATLRLQLASRTAPFHLAKARQLLDLRLEAHHALGDSLTLRFHAAGHSEADFQVLAHPGDYSSATFDTYGWQVGPREIYAALEWSALELRIGEQIINLGQTDMLSALDIGNPRDLRDPLMTEPEDLRLPVLTSRLGLTLDRTRIEVMLIHEPYFGLRAPPLGEWNPLRKLILEDPTLGPALDGRNLRNRDVPGHRLLDLDATQVHARVSWSGPGVDLSFLASDLLDPFGVPSLPPASAFDAETIEVPVAHPRFFLFGHGGAWTLGPCILRWELAYEHDRPLTVTQIDRELMLWSIARVSALRGVLGLTYAPSTTTQAMLELSQAYLFEAPPTGTALLFPAEAPQLAMRVNQMLFKERLTLAAFAYFIGVSPFNAWAARFDMRYDVTDDIEAAVGFTTYQPTGHFGVFYGFKGHDRLMFSLRWNVSS
jgi:hypothetical protein